MSLRRIPVRLLLMDETDSYPASSEPPSRPVYGPIRLPDAIFPPCTFCKGRVRVGLSAICHECGKEQPENWDIDGPSWAELQ